MIPSEPKKIDMPFAYEGAKNDIPTTGGEDTGNASLSLGFPPITQEPISQGGIPPQRKDFNGILYILSAFAHYAQSGALYSYDSTVDYVTNCIITYSNDIYICIANNGPSTTAGAVTPGTNTSYWMTLYSYLQRNDTGTVGSGTNPVYVSNGKTTASTSTVGSGTKPIYLSSGTITASSSTVGSGTKPVYMSSGTVTASSSTVGSGTNPVYMSSGTVTASGSTVGGTARGVYLNSGTLTALSSTVGSGTQPVYMSSGTVTASTSTVGASDTPVYLRSGVLTACSAMSSYEDGVTSSSRSDGYLQFSSGIKFMWGVATVYDLDYITFPISFSNTSYTVVFTPNSAQLNVAVLLKNRDSVRVGYPDETVGGITVNWVALGY